MLPPSGVDGQALFLLFAFAYPNRLTIGVFARRCICAPIFLASRTANSRLSKARWGALSELVGMDLSAERSEDGASGRYTAPWGSQWCQNHCSNHSGFVTGADTFVRTTLLAMAPGGYAISERLSFGYFSLARQRKVTAAPRRGDANRPTRSQVLHERANRTTAHHPEHHPFSRSTSAPPRGSLPPPVCFSSHARRSSRGVTPNLSR